MSKGEGRAFSSDAEARMAFDNGELHLQAPVKIRLRGVIGVDNGAGAEPWTAPEGWSQGEPLTVETTLGRVLFNETLPQGYRFVNYEIRKGQLSAIVNDLAERFPKVALAATLDGLKEAGFHWATWSGVTIGMEDVIAPPRKREILERYEKEAERIDKQYQRGLMTAEERRGELIEIWTKATNEVAKEMETALPQENPLWKMINSGARGNLLQLRQIAAIRGLVANPKGEIIPRPIKASYREGLSVLEYFISTHGARKGLADTALRTADSGYLTRRLVDVSQDVIIREEDCGTDRAIPMQIGERLDGKLRRARARRDQRARPYPGRRHQGAGRQRRRRAGSRTSTRSWSTRSSPPGWRRSGCAACSPASRSWASARPATAARCRPARRSTSARRSASSPPSRSVSRVRS